MSILLKKFTSAVSAAAIAFVAVAPSITNAASPFLPFAEALAKANVIATQSNEAAYRLTDPARRQEVAAIMIALNKADTSATTCTGKFEDVSATKPNSWVCKVVETALSKGLIAANTTFRPEANITRAEALAMILKGQGIEIATGATASFNDTPIAWQKDVANAALSKKIISANASFRPNASITRGELSVMAANAAGLEIAAADDDLNLEDLLGDDTGTSTGTTSTGTTTTPVATGDLSATLAASTPAATSVPATASAVPYMAVDFTAGTQDASISNIVLKREGFGTRDDLYRVWFELDGTRVSERASFLSDDTATVTFSPALVIKAGSTQTLKVVAEQKSGVNVINRISIVSTASITSGGTVKGNFPITGNSMTAANYSVATLDIAYQGASSDYKVGDKNMEFSRLLVLNKSSDKDVKVQSLKFKNSEDGEMSEDLENLALYEGGVKVSTAVVIAGRDVTFKLTDYVIKAGVSKTFVIQADANAARNTTGDKFKFELRYQEDLNAVEMATGFGCPNDVTTEASTRPTYTVKGSTITVSKSSTSPSTQTVSAGTNDVTLLVADATINQAFRADGLNLRIVTSGLTTDAANSFGNIRVYIGDRVYNSFDFATGYAGNATFTKSFDSSWTFDAGKTTIKVVANVKSAAEVNAKITAKLGDATNILFASPRYLQNDNTVSATDISVSADGLAATIGNDKVTVVRNDGFSAANTNIVAGVQGATVYKATISAGNVSDVKVNKLSYTITNGSVSNTNLLTNWKVKVNGVVTGSPRSISTGKVDFTDAVFTIAKNQTAQIEVTCDVATAYADTIITSFDNTSSTLLNVTSGQTIASANIAVTNGSALTVNTEGSLTVARDGNTANSAVVVAGTQGVELARFKMSTKYDEMYVKDLYVKNVNGAVADSNIATLKLYDSANPSVAIATASMEAGVAHFSIGDTTLKLPKDDSKVLIVKADFNTISNASQTGKLVKLAIDEDQDDTVAGVTAGTVNGVNVSSVATGNPLTLINGQNAVTAGMTAATTVNEMQIRKTALTVTSVNLSNSTFAAASDKEIYRFKVAADAAGDAYLKKLSLNITTGNSTVALSSVKIYKVSDQTNALNTADNAALAQDTTTKVAIELNNEETIAKGSEVEFVVKATIARGVTVSTKSSVSTNLVETTAAFAAAANYAGTTGDFIFSDNAASSATRDGLSVDYFSGFKTNSFPTDSKSLTE